MVQGQMEHSFLPAAARGTRSVQWPTGWSSFNQQAREFCAGDHCSYLLLAASFSLLTTTDSPIASFVRAAQLAGKAASISSPCAFLELERVEHLGAPHRFLLARLLLIGNRLRRAHQLLVDIDEIRPRAGAGRGLLTLALSSLNKSRSADGLTRLILWSSMRMERRRLARQIVSATALN